MPLMNCRVLLAIAVAAVTCLSTNRAEAVLPQSGDVVVGLSLSDATMTTHLVRGPASMGGGVKETSPWQSTAWLQSMEFDNYNGVAHNVNGNLLGTDFGNTSPTGFGGQIYSLATTVDPAPAGQLVGNTRPAPDNIGHDGSLTFTRIAGLSVAPNNTKIALAGYDSGTVIVYDYTPGDTMGAGASLSGGRQAALTTLIPGSSQGTAWADNDTVLAFSSIGSLLEVDAATMAVTTVATVTTPFVGSNWSSLLYNPEISPYVYGLYSGFATPSTTNKLYVFDPANNYAKLHPADPDGDGPLLEGIDLSTSSQTGREMAFDADGNLFIGGFGTMIDFIPAAMALNPATITDNSSIDWYDGTPNASFNGLDIGLGGAAPLADADFNSDTFVDCEDLNENWGPGYGTLTGAAREDGDADGDEDVDGNDFLIWQQQVTGSGAVGAGSAVPEPGSLALVTAALGGLLLRGRAKR
jgi:hypothetical protein